MHYVQHKSCSCVPITIMSKPLIDYYEEVLSKISYADQAVFRKELRKAFRHLVPAERESLKQWFRSYCVCKAPTEDPRDAAARTLLPSGDLN